MAERINARVTLHVEVFDAKELWQHAYGTYEEQNGTADQGDFEEMYGTEDDPDIGECIRMIFDPGESPILCAGLSPQTESAIRALRVQQSRQDSRSR